MKNACVGVLSIIESFSLFYRYVCLAAEEKIISRQVSTLSTHTCNYSTVTWQTKRSRNKMTQL